MAIYDFRNTEKKWQQYWKENRSFVAEKISEKPKYYVLDMFPYPSGAGLHVCHPLGYIATDIVTRYKRAKGYNVLHPMGFDAFGLPAEQYAIQHGVHPAETTRRNTERYLQQMERLGFHYDPECVLRTSDPEYYKWTQWIFIQLFKHWYDKSQEKARPITELVEIFERQGNAGIRAATDYKEVFTAAQWKAMSEKEQADMLMQYRLAYLDYALVNWCPALGTGLANEEVKDGRSERGNYPVERRKMKQWMLRITAYADRLLQGLETLDWSESMKAMQTNWIGRSEGASIIYQVEGVEDTIEVFTTRPDTLFGNTFMVLAPEHPLVEKITTDDRRAEVEEYVAWAANRPEKDRIADTNKTGVWTGGYALHPFTGERLPIWISDYVVITYGTGAIMAVPAHDERDYEFAKKFGIKIVEVISGGDISKEAYTSKEGIMVNSDFLNGLKAADAIEVIINKLEEKGIGRREVTYRQRDVIWSRQRYWGEPTPIYYKNDIAYPLDESELPLVLPEIESYKPSETGDPPLARAKDWVRTPDGGVRDLNTMPGLAGSSWYFFRYPDAANDERFVSREREQYWMPVDLYVGGTEHAVGHLMYSRFWTKFLYDMGEVSVEEPFQKLVNQGKIQGVSQLAYRHKQTGEFVSADLIPPDKLEEEYDEIHVYIGLVNNNRLDVEAYKAHTKQPELKFRLNDKGEFITLERVEKMSKSLYNTVNPDEVCEAYGTDTLRLYEMFLGPLEMAKPWNTDSISGVGNFIKRTWSLFIDEAGQCLVEDAPPTEAELKALHRMLKKVEEGIERLAFNTCVPAFMVFVKEMSKLNSRKRALLEPFVIALAPFAPHISEELWERMGNQPSILGVPFPQWEERYVVEDTIEYPVQINGKVRTRIQASAEAAREEVQEIALADEKVRSYTNGKTPRKVIVVPGRIVNIVL